MAMTGTMDNRVYRVKADACRLQRSRTNSLPEIRIIPYPKSQYLFRKFLIFFFLQRLAIIQTACTMPGIYPRSVKRMFSQKAPLNPTWRKTPSGGNSIAIKIRTRSMFFLRQFLCVGVSKQHLFKHQTTPGAYFLIR
jgi:hypothetical protein